MKQRRNEENKTYDIENDKFIVTTARLLLMFRLQSRLTGYESVLVKKMKKKKIKLRIIQSWFLTINFFLYNHILSPVPVLAIFFRYTVISIILSLYIYTLIYTYNFYYIHTDLYFLKKIQIYFHYFLFLYFQNDRFHFRFYSNYSLFIHISNEFFTHLLF